MVLSLLLHVMILFELLCDLFQTALLWLSYQPSLHRPNIIRGDTLLRYAIILRSVSCRLDIRSCCGSHWGILLASRWASATILLTTQLVMATWKIAIFWPVQFRTKAVLLPAFSDTTRPSSSPIIVDWLLRSKCAHRLLCLWLILIVLWWSLMRLLGVRRRRVMTWRGYRGLGVLIRCIRISL